MPKRVPWDPLFSYLGYFVVGDRKDRGEFFEGINDLTFDYIVVVVLYLETLNTDTGIVGHIELYEWNASDGHAFGATVGKYGEGSDFRMGKRVPVLIGEAFGRGGVVSILNEIHFRERRKRRNKRERERT